MLERFVSVADTFLEMEVFVSYGLAPLLPVARLSAIGEHVMGSLAFFVCGGFFSAHAGPLQVLHSTSLCAEFLSAVVF